MKYYWYVLIHTKYPMVVLWHAKYIMEDIGKVFILKQYKDTKIFYGHPDTNLGSNIHNIKHQDANEDDT